MGRGIKRQVVSRLALTLGRNIAGFGVLHSFTKSRNIFLKQCRAVPLSGVTGRRSQLRKRAPDLFHEKTTYVEGEALWLSVLTLTSLHCLLRTSWVSLRIFRTRRCNVFLLVCESTQQKMMPQASPSQLVSSPKFRVLTSLSGMPMMVFPWLRQPRVLLKN